jgi:dienelactone hydrolase
MLRRLASPGIAVAVAVLAVVLRAPLEGRPSQPPPAVVDEAFARFFDARTADDVSGASSAILASGVQFEDVFSRLKRGRSYPADSAGGVVQQSRRDEGVEYFYTVIVPDSYTPARPWQVRIQLHGGVGRIQASTPPRGAPTGRLDGAEQIVVLPYAWKDAPWWSRQQERNLAAILDAVKRQYNVDENRVVLSGVSDGGTGAYYMAMRQITPFASFLPLNGFFMVLKNEMMERDGDVFPNNMVNKPLFVVNGGRDPLYPTATVDPYIDHLRKGGVAVVYKPQPGAGHDTSWWPELKDTFEQFVSDHPRRPLPDTVTWETGEVPARAHWLVIDRLSPSSSNDATLPDLNERATPPAAEFGVRSSGNRINRVIAGSNAQKMGLLSGDVVTFINNQPTGQGVDIEELLGGLPEGRPLLITVNRGGQGVRVTGRYAPTPLPHEADLMFPPNQRSGRVDLVRTGNTVDVRTRGVDAFRLLLSPDQFDLTKPVTVTVNGRTLVERVVEKDVATLLKWAATDNDRTMLFGTEVRVEVPR